MRVEDALESMRVSEMGNTDNSKLGWQIIRTMFVPALNSRGLSILQHLQSASRMWLVRLD